MIFLTVGSALPFDRLVEMVDRSVRTGVIQSEVFAQIGHGSYVPSTFAYVPMLSRTEYDDRFANASAVISHAGIGTIATAIRMRKPLLVLPRDPVLGELVDDHQRKTARKFEEQGHLLMFSDDESLTSQIVALQTFAPTPREPNVSGIAIAIGSYLSMLIEKRSGGHMSLGKGN